MKIIIIIIIKIIAAASVAMLHVLISRKLWYLRISLHPFVASKSKEMISNDRAFFLCVLF